MVEKKVDGSNFPQDPRIDMISILYADLHEVITDPRSYMHAVSLGKQDVIPTIEYLSRFSIPDIVSIYSPRSTDSYHEGLNLLTMYADEVLDEASYYVRFQTARTIWVKLIDAVKNPQEESLTLPLDKLPILLSPQNRKFVENLYPYSSNQDPKFLKNAKRAGIQACLDVLSKEATPLLRYTRNFAERRMRLERLTDKKKESGKLPTKIPGIFVQYTYVENSNKPELALLVYPCQ